jgi:hypothetical protein
MHLAPGAMGTRAPRDTPRLAGVGLLVRWRSWVIEGFLPFCIVRADVRTQVPENKNRAADVPAELRHALHRRLAARRNGELGARVTSGRDSRETQSVNGELRVVNPPLGNVENCNCMAHTETQRHRERTAKVLLLWLSVASVASV